MEVQCLYHYRLVNIIHWQAIVLCVHVILKIIFYFPSVNNCLIFYLPTILCIDSLFFSTTFVRLVKQFSVLFSKYEKLSDNL